MQDVAMLTQKEIAHGFATVNGTLLAELQTADTLEVGGVVAQGL